MLRGQELALPRSAHLWPPVAENARSIRDANRCGDDFQLCEDRLSSVKDSGLSLYENSRAREGVRVVRMVSPRHTKLNVAVMRKTVQ